MVSHHLDGFLRIVLPGVLHPVPVLGFVPFLRLLELSEDNLAAHIPVTRSPLDEVPSSAAGPHHCGLVPSCCF